MKKLTPQTQGFAGEPDYIGNMIYENGALKRILIDGGYIEGGVYYYYLTDHQGNNRLVCNASGTVIQKNHYYPFGMAFAENTVPEQGKQPYKYNNKELDQMSGLNQYDYSARYYDPAIARFTTPDPLAEKYYNISPFVHCNNNPVNAVDPTGLTDYKINENGYIYDSSSLWDKIKRIFTGPDKTDNLIAQNGNTLTMKAGTMTDFIDKKDNNGVTVGQSFKIENSDVAEQVHEFLSENVKKEYGVVDDVKNGVSTSTITSSLKSEGNDASNVAQSLLQSGADVLQITHNHPIGSDPTPSGYKVGQYSSGDKDVVNHLNKYFPNNFITYRVYDPKNKVYIYYDANKIYKTEPKKH